MSAASKSFYNLNEDNYQCVWAGRRVGNHLWIVSLPWLLPYPGPSVLPSHLIVTVVLCGSHGSSSAQWGHCRMRRFIRSGCRQRVWLRGSLLWHWAAFLCRTLQARNKARRCTFQRKNVWWLRISHIHFVHVLGLDKIMHLEKLTGGLGWEEGGALLSRAEIWSWFWKLGKISLPWNQR